MIGRKRRMSGCSVVGVVVFSTMVCGMRQTQSGRGRSLGGQRLQLTEQIALRLWHEQTKQNKKCRIRKSVIRIWWTGKMLCDTLSNLASYFCWFIVSFLIDSKKQLRFRLGLRMKLHSVRQLKMHSTRLHNRLHGKYLENWTNRTGYWVCACL